MLQVWVDACNEFRRQEREDIFLQEPSSERLIRYERELKFFVRSARALLKMARDPDLPASQYIPALQGKLRQLEESLEALLDPLSDSEADAFIQKHFPDEASTRAAS